MITPLQAQLTGVFQILSHIEFEHNADAMKTAKQEAEIQQLQHDLQVAHEGMDAVQTENDNLRKMLSAAESKITRLANSEAAVQETKHRLRLEKDQVLSQMASFRLCHHCRIKNSEAGKFKAPYKKSHTWLPPTTALGESEIWPPLVMPSKRQEPPLAMPDK